MKKILIITHGFLPDIDGGIIVAYDYANLLSELGYDVTVLSREYSTPISNTKFHYIQVPNRFGEYFWLFNFGSFLNSFSLDEYDCIILNQYPISTIAGKYFDDKTLSKCIPIIQGAEVEGIYQNKRHIHNLVHVILRMKHWHRKTLKESRKIVSVSMFHKLKVVKAAKIASYAHKVQIVYTGINKEIFHHVLSGYKQQMGWEDKELLITVSRIEKMKGYLEMLSIFNRIIEKDDNFRWVIIGDGPFIDELRLLVAEKRLMDKICIMGSKPREELSYYYSAADCFWLLSNYDETFGLVYLEAQACGIPAIGRNKGGVAEAIIQEKTGFLINNEEECLEILLNKKYKAINRDSLYTFVEKFDKIKAAEELIS